MSNLEAFGKSIIENDSDAKRLIEAVVERTATYLSDEVFINVLEVKYNLNNEKQFDLRNLTSIITVEDHLKITLAFSYDKSLIEKIFEGYSQGIEVAADEVQSYIEESAGDMINIVLGNVLSQFQQSGKAFGISTPVIINGAKSIGKYKNTQFFTAELKSDFGIISICCITPGEQFRKQLKPERSDFIEKS
jgi:hypothetical protein